MSEGLFHIGRTTTYAAHADSALLDEWRLFDEEVLTPALEEIRQARTSRELTQEGRENRTSKTIAKTLASPRLTALRDRRERAQKHYSDLRAAATAAPTVRVTNFQEFFDAWIAYDEAKKVTADLGTDSLQIYAALATAIDRGDAVALRTLEPLRRWLTPDDARLIETALIARAGQADAVRAAEWNAAMHNYMASAVERDLEQAARWPNA